MGNETNNANQMSDCMEEPRLTRSRYIRTNDDVICELAFERREISQNIAKLEKAIEANPKEVCEHHKELWRKQAEAMRAYEEVLGERIKDLID